MKPRIRILTSLSAIPFGVALAFLLAPASEASEVSESSFGGCGVSSSANFITVGTWHPTAGAPTGTAAAVLCPGPLASEYTPTLEGVPQIHLVPTPPGALTLVAVPDLPAWHWQSSEDLMSWFALSEGATNPVVVTIEAPRRFFRLMQP